MTISEWLIAVPAGMIAWIGGIQLQVLGKASKDEVKTEVASVREHVDDKIDGLKCYLDLKFDVIEKVIRTNNKITG